MMRSPLLQALLDKHNLQLVTEENTDDFLKCHQHTVLFFTENPQHFAESNDVAVILPELLQLFENRLVAGVVAEETERRLHKRYAFNKWPALVFLRDGLYLGVITGMHDWQIFRQEFENLLKAEPVKAPTFTIPIVAEITDTCHSVK